jgi:membrane protein implicated in regulation of membrane protease activity
MEEDLAWAIVGLALVIVELLTGTFYLLVLGIAAFGAALAAWLGHDFPLQAMLGGVIAAVGCYGIHAYHAKNATQQMASIDAGQPASFELWTDQAAHRARVRYRGASWDALVEGDVEGNAAPEAGANLYVLTTNGNTLKVTTRRPA